MTHARAITITLTLANLCLFVIFVSAWFKPANQNKTIILPLTLSKEPVDISFKLKGQAVNARETARPEEGIRAQEFEADPQWVKELTLELRNTSGKTITYIQVNLHFPEVTKGGRVALEQIFLGVDPERKFSRAELKLAPNETIEIPLTEKYSSIRSLVETVGKVPLGNVTKLWVEFHAALFQDETLYQAGTWYRRNPEQNEWPKWIKIDNP